MAQGTQIKAGLKWGGLVMELYILFLFYSSALLVPGNYDISRLAMIGVCAALSLLCAYASATQFVSSESQGDGLILLLSTAPLVIWMSVTAIVGVQVIPMFVRHMLSR
jgi:hypothetical protein